MQTKLFSRSITSALAFATAIGLVGCGADGWNEGASGEGAQIGNVEQAVRVLNPNTDVQFSGALKLPGTETMLVIGGYDSSGNGVDLTAIYDPASSGSFTFLTNFIDGEEEPTDNPFGEEIDGLGELQIAPVPGINDTFVVAGGRPAVDAPAATFTRIVVLSGTSLTWITPGQLLTGVVIHDKNFQKCGTSKLIAAGGMVEAGMVNIAGTDSTGRIQVFTYNVGTPSASAWVDLKQGGNVVKLQKQHGYQTMLHLDDNNFLIVGGANANEPEAIGTANSTSNVEKLIVDNNCDATNAVDIDLGAGVDLRAVFANPLPEPRARMASIAQAVTFNPGGGNVAYDFMVTSGNDDTSGYVTPTETFLYDVGTDAWDTLTGANSDITAGRSFAKLAILGSTVQLVSGVLPSAGVSFDDTTAIVEVFTPATQSWDQSPSGIGEPVLAIDRVGSWVEPLTRSGVTKVYAGLGATHVNSATPTSMPGDIETTN